MNTNNQVLTLCVGNCGCKIGSKFFDLISEEHNLSEWGEKSPNQKEMLSYYQVKPKSIHPLALFIDYNQASLDHPRTGKYGYLYDSDNFAFTLRKWTGNNNYAKGFYSPESVAYSDEVIQKVNNLLEKNQQIKQIQIIHGIGAATGAGLGARLIQKIHEEYSEKVLNSIMVFPSPRVNTTIVEPLNTVLSIKSTYDCLNAIHVIDNEKLQLKAFQEYNITQPNFATLNHLAAVALSNISAPLRFLAFPDIDPFFEKSLTFATKFLTNSMIGNINSKLNPKYEELKDSDFHFEELLKTQNYYIHSEVSQDEKWTEGLVITREKFMNPNNTKERKNYLDQALPTGSFNLTQVESTPPLVQKCVHLTGVYSGINQVLKRIQKQFDMIYKRKSYLFHYTTVPGMEENEFFEAENKLSDLIYNIEGI